ncbi:MAG: ATP-binding cassette domain-containing protein [Sneathiellales bacterium]|nr:ATP-binding cassette domain-containing protein [Sneathiellales bacterium]
MSEYLKIQGLGKSFGALKAVNDVSFSVGKGEILGIAGPNGSGKSTLFNLITKIPFPADRGEIFLDGKRIDRLSNTALAKLGVIRTFQREALFGSLSCIDNILVAVEQTNGARGREAERLADEASDIVGFPKNFHNMPAVALPVFYQKQLMITTAVAQKPEILLLDEPASSLIDSEIDWVRDAIVTLNKRGITILLIEHILSLLTGVSDRLLVMEQGQKIALGQADEVIRDPIVIEAFLGKPQ